MSCKAQRLSHPSVLSAVLAVIGAMLALTSCGGNGSSSPSIPAPSNLSYPTSVIRATVGQAITTSTPTVTGTVSSYTVSPSLPAGLSLNSISGAISGTPTAVSSEASYVVTASNTSGSTKATLQISVTVPAPVGLAYPIPTITAVVGQPIITDLPALTSGTATTYSVSPALPAGLKLDDKTGAVYGTPTAAANSATYTLTASNPGGSTSAAVNISAVGPFKVLLELGHNSRLATVRMSGSRVLSQDYSGRWNLWDYSSGTILATGNTEACEGCVAAEMAGSTILIRIPNNGAEVRSATDGHLLSIISFGQSGTPYLAVDGSYVYAASTTGLTIWSLSGQLLASRSGNYLNGFVPGIHIFAAPGSVLVANGPNAYRAIETISTVDGSSTVGTEYNGEFAEWFGDGQRYVTYIQNGAWVYSKTGNLVGTFTINPFGGNPTSPVFGGWGNYAWVRADGTLWINGISAGTWIGYPGLAGQASGSTMAVQDNGTVTVIDLTAATLAPITVATPVPSGGAFAASSASQWVLENGNGGIIDGASLASGSTAHYLAPGKTWSIAGSSTNAAIATSSGEIFYLDPAASAAPVTVSNYSSKIALSADGSVLAAYAGDKNFLSNDRSLKLFSMPTAALIQDFPYTFSWADGLPVGPYMLDFSMSADGSTVAQTVQTHTGQVLNVTSAQNAALWSTNFLFTYADPVYLSSDGSLAAICTSRPANAQTVTDVYQNGAKISALPGCAAGWVDNSRLLVNHYASGADNVVRFVGSQIYNPAGTAVSATTVPELLDIQAVSSDLVYAPKTNAVYSLSSGQAEWTGPSDQSGLGAVANSYTVWEYNGQVLAAQSIP